MKEEALAYFYNHKSLKLKNETHSFYRNFICLVRYPDNFTEIRNPYGLMWFIYINNLKYKMIIDILYI